MAAAPRLKALPQPNEQTFIDTARKIREKRLTRLEDIPTLPRALSEKAIALLTAMTDFDESGFWKSYDALTAESAQLNEWREVIATAAPPDDTPEVIDNRFVTSPTGKRLLKFSTVEDIFSLPDAIPLIAGILEKGTISLIYGLSGTGKTFTCLDLALCVCHGIPWHGREVQQGTVWYINTEGGRGLKKRLQAWYKEHPELTPDSERFKVITWSLDLREYFQEITNTIEDGEAPALIIADNFSMCAPGVDQNKQEQVAPVLRLLIDLANKYDSHIMIVHHTNKTGDVNGTMAFRNHVDVQIELVKEDTADRDSPIIFRSMKERDSEPFRDIRTELKRVVLYTDPDTLKTVTSCVVVNSDAPEIEPRNKLKDVEQNIFDILGDRSLAFTEWQSESTKELGISPATFTRARSTLEQKGMVQKVRIEGKRFEVYRRIAQDREAWNE